MPDNSETLFADPRRGGLGRARDLARDKLMARMFGDPVGRTRVGRYLLKDRVGAGATGTVYAAEDDQLDRQVAVKVLRQLRDDDNAVERVLGEARTLAKLNHPNVVHVYEAGIDEDALFIAMEYVEGGTLRDWQEAELRSWPSVVSKYLAAGRGLAAAHRAGLVHRDFKPDNVLVSRDGQVKVIDFGLAHGAMRGASLEETAQSEDASGMPTYLANVAGTPAYMSPEQYAGAVLDGRADQFSFCVALYEALSGERPFQADSIATLARKISHGRRPPMRNSAAPRWVCDIIHRGLSSDLDARHASMEVLLDRLGADPWRARKRVFMGLGLGGAVVTALALGRVSSLNPNAADHCPSAKPRVERLWNETVKNRMAANFAESGAPFADHAWERVRPRLDRFGSDWVEARQDACSATHVRKEQSGELLDARMQCLDTALLAFQSTVSVLETIDESGIEHAVAAVMELPDLDRCASPTLVRAQSRLASDVPAQSITAHEQRLASAHAFHLVASYDAARQEADEALAVAERTDNPPGRARSLAELGSIEVDLGLYEAAEEKLREAHFQALALEDHSTAAAAATRLGYVLVAHRQKFGPAADWVRHGRVAADKAKDARLQAAVLNVEGLIAAETGVSEVAHGKFMAAIESTEQAYGKDHPQIVNLEANLANLISGRGRFQDAADLAEKSAADARRILGDHHPAAARPLLILGRCQSMLGDQVAAEASLESALTLAQSSYECPHPLVRLAHDYLGNVTRVAGKLDAAQLHLEDAVACARKDPDHKGGLAAAMQSLAMLLAEREKGEQALAKLQEAMEIWAGTDAGSTSPAMANLHRDRGRVLLNMERPSEALESIERAISIHGPDMEGTPIMADILGLRMTARRATGDAAGAEQDLERIAAIEAANPGQLSQ